VRYRNALKQLNNKSWLTVMSTSPMNVTSILDTYNREQWIAMPNKDFIKYVVEPLNMMGIDPFSKLIRQVPYEKFELLIRKCWEEQDKEPNPDNYEEAYEETLPIVLLMEKSLNVKIQTERDMDRKNNMAKQLAMISVILSPHRLENVVKKVNKK
jgi:hypothetical protein